MPAEALGFWQSSFGAVKIEADTASGLDRLMGVWLYQRSGQDVIGYFEGTLRGNVLEFTWHEPAQPEDLLGGGYLVFEPGGGQFTGEWWTRDQTRTGAWTGWRPAAAAPTDASQGSGEVREDESSDTAGQDQPGEAGMPSDSPDPAAGDRLSW